jgi:GTP-binding protein Era
VLFISDLSEVYLEADIVERIAAIKVPLIIIINKVDLSTQNEINKLMHGWKKAVMPFAVIPVSAKTDFNVSEIIKTLVELIPESPPFFGKEDLSDATQRFFTSEIIREKILFNYDKEIPYSTEVGIEEFKEQKDLIRISAVIYVERDTQKGILIGRNGEAIKKIGMQSRRDIEKLLGKKVFLEIQVKVEKDWRKKESALKKFGYRI